MYICSSYEIPGQDFKVLIVSPHGSDGRAFFERFPEIHNHEQVRKKGKIFNQYVRLEQDKGAHDLSHQLARELMGQGFSSMVFEMDYPKIHR